MEKLTITIHKFSSKEEPELYHIQITVGVQSFTIDYEADEVQSIEWYADQLKTAFLNFNPIGKVEIIKKY